tara:strand:+ start:145 stop:363 length:219 start_codon:yes stop_codon:yes gene_type:complete
MMSKQEQIDSLIEENHRLKKELEALEEENEQLWIMLDEMKHSEGSAEKLMEDMLREAIQEQLLRSMKTVGEA